MSKGLERWEHGMFTKHPGASWGFNKDIDKRTRNDSMEKTLNIKPKRCGPHRKATDFRTV